MFNKRNLSREDIILIIANLIPVYGFGSRNGALQMHSLYNALETIIVGAMTLLKLE